MTYLLGRDYARRGDAIFWETSRVKGADADSFRNLGGGWATDGHVVYSLGDPVRGADASTFVVLSEVFAKDRVAVYYLGGKAKGLDATTFEALDPGAQFLSPGAAGIGYEGYGSDSKSVYHYAYTVGKPSVVRGADRDSFRSLDGKFGKDRDRVYVGHRTVKGADPGSWFRLQALYSRDKQAVFYDNFEISGADPASFIALWGRRGVWAKDKNCFYEIGRPRPMADYLHDLEKELAHLNQVKVAIQASKL